jgi:pantoate--beta-alanine ligase
MQVIDTVEAWRKALDDERAAGRTVGLVPTMGALHAGHASLIDAAARDCDVVGVTVFVNPLQFGANEDLAAYPRTLDHDVELAATHGAAYVFAPPEREMYPHGAPRTTVSVGDLTTRWEGETRPGHFDGVATVVTKLFAQAGACRAYFGEKDYQQLCVIRQLVADLDLPVEVIGCPTVREPDGLALSSRNAYLTPDERTQAAGIHRALHAGARALQAGAEPHVATAAMRADLAAFDPGRSARLLVAARLGRTRLIDNLGVTR